MFANHYIQYLCFGDKSRGYRYQRNNTMYYFLAFIQYPHRFFPTRMTSLMTSLLPDATGIRACIEEIYNRIVIGQASSLKTLSTHITYLTYYYLLPAAAVNNTSRLLPQFKKVYYLLKQYREIKSIAVISDDYCVLFQDRLYLYYCRKKACFC